MLFSARKRWLHRLAQTLHNSRGTKRPIVDVSSENVVAQNVIKRRGLVNYVYTGHSYRAKSKVSEILRSVCWSWYHLGIS